MPSTVYALRDPRDGAVRYVGYTTNLKQRLHGHIYSRTKTDTPRTLWVRELKGLGLEPIIEPVHRASGENDESEWIAWFRAAGFDLLNMSDGGPGAPGVKWTPERRAKHRASTIGHEVSAETREKIRAAHLGRINGPCSDVTRAKIRAAKVGRPAHTKTHCKRGHELVPENLRKNRRGERFCILCARIRSRGYRQSRQAAQRSPVAP